ncbi:MAG: tyrosine-type recombinase/integrase [Candidatus Thiodiazotropha sp.]
MADIRKRVGKKGTTYQVRYPSKTTKSGYAFKSFNTLKEARAFNENLGNLKEPHSCDLRTVAQGMQRWLEICEHEGRGGRDPISPATLEVYAYRAEMINSYQWTKQLHELEAPDIAVFRSWLLKQYSRDQARKALSSFHSMILEMNHQGLMTHDPAFTVSIRKESRYDEPHEIPSVADIRSLLNAADSLANSKNRDIAKAWERYRPMLYLAVDTGMRPQEYLVLPERGMLEHGVKVMQALDRSYKIGPPKTRAGRRIIPVSEQTLDMVRHYMKSRDNKNEHGLVFPTKSGGFQRYNNWRRKGWSPAIEKAGLLKEVVDNGETIVKAKYTPYSLRHFFASMLINENKNLKYIQTVMGHEDVKLTLDVYGHLIRERDAVDMAQSGGILGQIL